MAECWLHRPIAAHRKHMLPTANDLTLHPADGTVRPIGGASKAGAQW
jgi:hypothetical protein